MILYNWRSRESGDYRNVFLWFEIINFSMINIYETRIQSIKNKFLRILTMNILLFFLSYFLFHTRLFTCIFGSSKFTQVHSMIWILKFFRIRWWNFTWPLAIGSFYLRCLPTLRNRISLDPLPVVSRAIIRVVRYFLAKTEARGIF